MFREERMSFVPMMPTTSMKIVDGDYLCCSFRIL